MSTVTGCRPAVVCLMSRMLGLLVVVFLLGGCASLLPQSRTNTTPFKTYEDARQALISLVPMKSDRGSMEKNGFFLGKHPNTILLTHADVARRFLPSAILKREDLDPGILNCLESREDCGGLEISGAKIQKIRTGNFWSDFLNFTRRTETTGWRFTALVLLVKDTVVYRSWSGQPALDEVDVTRNPLGPFQYIGPAAIGTYSGQGR